MASNPPFQVEDQTDEDFFDKLVDDDFGPSQSAPKFTEGNDSDDAKAFANLSVGEDSGGEGAMDTTAESDSADACAKTSTADAEDNNLLQPSETLASISKNESTTDELGSKAVPDLLRSKSNESEGSGVKEVGWSSFHADSVQNGSHGFGSYSDFFSDLGDNSGGFLGGAEESVNDKGNIISGIESHNTDGSNGLLNHVQHEGGQSYGSYTEDSTNRQDLNSIQYWENLNPGWKYDPNTGQWYEVGVQGNDATSDVQGSHYNEATDWTTVSEGKSEVSYLQQAAQSVVGTISESETTERVSNWNQVSHGNNGYPEHMIFDPQYPGWYYDTIVQEWRSLESYTSSELSMGQDHALHNQNGFASAGGYAHNTSSVYGEFGQTDNFGSQGINNEGQHGNWAQSYSYSTQHGMNMWQPVTVAQTEAVSSFGGNQLVENSYGSRFSVNNHADQQRYFDSKGAVPVHDSANQNYGEANGFTGLHNFVPSGNYSQQINQANLKQNDQMGFSNNMYGSQKSSMEQNEPMHFANNFYADPKQANVVQQQFQSSQHLSYAPNMGRSSAGRPPHALVTFGFGGKLIVVKDNNSLHNSSYGTQGVVGGSISVLNLMEVVTGNTGASSTGGDSCNYLHALCQQSFPGPLLGGNVGSKELNKWIDERVASCDSPDMDYRKAEVLKLLLSLLKIGCRHYGKFRSPFGTDSTLKETDTPEAAVAKLFASAKRNDTNYREYGALSHCLQQLPSEEQVQATASNVQNLLVSGRKTEALQCAQEGQLWGPALVLASQLGDQFYVDTVKQMALRQLVAGSPLRTLCLLIAGQPADVFSTDTAGHGTLSGAVNMPQQPAQVGSNCMLDDWEENLAVMTANRTKDDSLVIIHLGDCLWKERSEITAAHICYLVADANFESYSDTARLCLIGADHWKFPRTYASPEAIQRTELYEYSKVLGNSQFILLPFQPYKLIYAYMLAEVGKVSESLKYCQVVLKSLKTGRAPEVETWKPLVLALEERIKMHQQGGYTANLAPAKLVGKLLNFFDSTAHRVVGGLPPPAPSTSQAIVQGNEQYHQPVGPRVSASQSTMAMSSLMPSASMEPISEWAADGNRMTMSNRSVSEPDFGRTPRQVDTSKEATSSDAHGKASGSGGASRFARFGFGSQLLQKTVGLVLRPRPDRQAKLGESNKFYYDEKLKRWVEEGTEPPAEEAALPPPPKALAFQNGTLDYTLTSALQTQWSPLDGSPTYKTPTSSEHIAGIPPPIPSSSNQFSARGRMGVRSRYVDTFNQGGGNPASLFHSPSLPSVKPAVAANTKFFIPTAAPSGEQAMESIAESAQEENTASEAPSTSTLNDSFQAPPVSTSSSMTMQRFPSMDNIPRRGLVTNSNGSLSSHSRRTASWSGSFSEAISPPKSAEIKPLGEALGMSPPTFMPSPASGGSFGDLHEVEL